MEFWEARKARKVMVAEGLDAARVVGREVVDASQAVGVAALIISVVAIVALVIAAAALVVASENSG